MWLLIISKSVGTHSTSVLQSRNEAVRDRMVSVCWRTLPRRVALSSAGPLCDVYQVSRNRNPPDPRRDDDIDG